MVRSSVVLSLLPILLLFAVPFVSSQNVRGAISDANKIDEQRRLGWLYDMLKDLAKEAAEDETAAQEAAEVPTASPTVTPIKPLTKKRKKKLQQQTNNPNP
jgi:hypothetical protein